MKSTCYCNIKDAGAISHHKQAVVCKKAIVVPIIHGSAILYRVLLFNGCTKSAKFTRCESKRD